MLSLISGKLSKSYSVLALILVNLVISMPAPPTKRSPESSTDQRNGFSTVPKILEIQLPLKIATKDDLVAWAKYVMGLMASKINITLTTVKEAPTKTPINTRPPEIFDNARQPQNIRNSAHRNSQSVYQMDGAQNLGGTKNFENSRYAEHIRNLGNNFERVKVHANFRPSENNRQPDNIRNSIKNSPKEKPSHLPTLTINGVTSNGLFNNRQTQANYQNVGFLDTTLPSPLEITASINLPRTRDKDFRGAFSTANSVKAIEPQLFVPPFPDLGPGVDVINNGFLRNLTSVSPPSRTYLPATTDNIKFPNDPFITRYFFDGVERNASNNLAVFPSDITFTTQNPLIFTDEIPVPVKNIDLLNQRNLSSLLKPLLKVPFEAVITFTRENSIEPTTLKDDRDKYFLIPTRDPLDQFPPYFDTNYTVTNESGQINVVFEDGNQVTESRNGNRKNEKKKQEKKQDSSKRQQSKKEKSGKKMSAVVSQFLKTFAALRRNNSIATDLTPPPLNPQGLFSPQRAPVTQKVPVGQRAPAGQRYSPPQRTQTYPREMPPSALRLGRRNRTSLAQQNEDDDNESNSGSNSAESGEKNDSNGNESDENDSNGSSNSEDDNKDDKSGSSESSSSESESSEEEEGGSIKAVIDLLQLAAPLLEDLSDPESDANIADLLELGLPLIQELSEGDGENPGFDVPGLLVPILLQLSGGADGMGDSSAILTPILQLSAPLIGPLVGPLLVPLSRQSSNTPDQGGSSPANLIKGLSGPLLQPAGPGKMSILSNLIAGTISSLSKPGGKSDIASLIKAVVAGSVAGTSAGSSGPKDSYGAPTGYGTDSYSGAPASNSYAAVPSESQNPLLALGSSIGDVLKAIVKVISSLVNAITGLLGASSKSSSEPETPEYGPPRPSYGPPRPNYGAPSSYASPTSEPFSITTSRSQRLIRP